MENESYRWIVYAAVSFLSLIGFAKLVEMYVSRFWSKRDKRDEIHASNQGAQIQADSAFLQSLIKRVEALEKEHKEMQNKLLNQAVTSARTEEENKHLKETNQRQEKEILSLREDRKKDGVKIVNLENELGRTQSDLKEAYKLIKDLSDKIDSIEKDKMFKQK